LCVALIDIDNFKKLNDTLGHQAGDQALVHLAQVIKESLRPADNVARYGGEEFVIILPDTQLKEGVEAIERLQREMTKKFFLNNNERILVTFSAGVALRNADEDQEEVVGRADKAMYVAKTTGKNRVIAAE
jgi:diguanylate cyclase